MHIYWWPMLLYPLPLLAIPLAIALGRVVRGGPITVMSVGAGLGIGSFWLAMRDFYTPYHIGGTLAVLWVICSALVGAILLVGAWALALAQAFHARQWLWVALLCLVVYITAAALVLFETSGYAFCLFDQAAFCGQSNPAALPLFLAADFLAPVVLLAYGLWPAGRQPRALPEGLVVSRLTDEER